MSNEEFFENKKELDLHFSECKTYTNEFIEEIGYDILSSLICKPLISNSILPNDINEIKSTIISLSSYINSKNIYDQNYIDYDIQKLHENCEILKKASNICRKLYINLISNYDVITKFKRLKALKDETNTHIQETYRLIRKLNSLHELVDIVDTLVNINYKIECNLLNSQMKALNDEIELNTNSSLKRLTYAYERLEIYSNGISCNLKKIYYKTILNETLNNINEDNLPVLFKNIIIELKDRMSKAMNSTNNEVKIYSAEINDLIHSFKVAFENLSYPRPKEQIDILKKILLELSKINN